LSIEPPRADRPAQFSNVVGSYTIEVSAEPAAVAVEEPIALRVIIKGSGPTKYQPARKHLKLFPDRWANDFHVEPVPDEDRLLPDQGTWEFAYRLRPRHPQVVAIDGIRLVYYQPAAGAGMGRFQTTYAEARAIAVKARPAALVPDNLPIRTAPASFYELPPVIPLDALLSRPPSTAGIPAWVFALLFLAPPLLTVASLLGWHCLNPSRGQRRQRVRSQAARQAIQALEGANGEAAWIVLARYLRDRLDFPAEEPTPAEVRQFLRRRGVSRPVADNLAAFLGTCAAARFAPAANDAAPLRHEAGQLVVTLEDDLCTP
jgi:hypothetical protein